MLSCTILEALIFTMDAHLLHYILVAKYKQKTTEIKEIISVVFVSLMHSLQALWALDIQLHALDAYLAQ